MLILKVNQEGKEQKEKIHECHHKDCGKKFESLKQLEVHHDRYSKYCAAIKRDLRIKLSKSKAKIKQMRKENGVLKRLLTQHQITFEKELRGIKQEKGESID